VTQRWAVGLILAAMAAGGTGCASSALSSSEQMRLMSDQNRRLNTDLQTSQQKVADLLASGRTPNPVTASEDPYRAVAVRLGSASGVVDRGAGPIRERLRIIVEPLDATGDVVKRAGSLELEAREPAARGQPSPIYHVWKFSAAEMMETWLSGLGGYAYILRLPWPDGKPPAGDTLIFKVTFATPDGRVLAAQCAVPIEHGPVAPPAPAPSPPK
jgi:hypothetical protein